MPSIFRVAIVFSLILFAIRKNLSLGNAFALGGIFLAIFFGMSWTAASDSIFRAVLDLNTVSLSLIVVLILVLSKSMEVAGQMSRLLKEFQGLIASPRLNLVVFPALIGLLPMPGGALFSAPMVKDLGRQSNLLPPHLSYINYWFRHIWEYWWPMYPGVLLATLMADIILAAYILSMLPFTVMAAYIGWVPVESAFVPHVRKKADRRRIRFFLMELMPILIAIIPGLACSILFSAILPRLTFAKEAGLISALCGAVAWVWYKNRFSAKQIRRLLINTQQAKMLYMVFAILIFKELLTDSDAVSQVADELTQWRVPLILVAAILPFIVGVITGITVAFVGTTFPIIIPLVHSHGQPEYMLAYVMFSLVFGFIGVLISPLHLCLTLSNQYFNARISEVYRLLRLPCLGLAMLATVYFLLLRLFISI